MHIATLGKQEERNQAEERHQYNGENMAAAREQGNKIRADESWQRNKETMLIVPEVEDVIQADERRQQNGEHMMNVWGREDETQADERRQHSRAWMTSIRLQEDEVQAEEIHEENSGILRSFVHEKKRFKPKKDVNRIEGIWRPYVQEKNDSGQRKTSKKQRAHGIGACGGVWRWKIFSTPFTKRGCKAKPQIVSESCLFIRRPLDLGKMDSESPNCGPVYFVHDRVKTSDPSEPYFLTCCQRRAFLFQPLSEKLTVRRQLLKKSDTDPGIFPNRLRSYNAVLSTGQRLPIRLAKQGSSKFNLAMTVQQKANHYIGRLIPPHQIKHFFPYGYVHDTNEVKRATITESSVGQNLSQSISFDLWSAITRAKSYGLTFQSLSARAQRDSRSIYKMIIRADRRPTSEHTRIYNAPESFKVAGIIVRSEYGQVGTGDIVLRNRGVTNQNGNQVLDNIPSAHRSYDSLSYKPLLLDDRDGWYQWMVMKHEADCILIVLGSESHAIEAGSGAKPVALNHDGH